MEMSIPIIVLFALLAVAIFVGICIIVVMLDMRNAYSEQQEQLTRAVSAFEEFQKLQPEFLTCVRHMKSDGSALQEIALQIEGAVAALKESASAAMSGAAERQGAAIDSLRDHIDAQEERICALLQHIVESLHAAPRAGEDNGGDRPAREMRRENADLSRFRREALRRPEFRFTLLKEWVSTNALAIVHRASRSWKSPNDLIENIPSDLEPVAAVLKDSVLLVGTRDHCATLAVPLRELEPGSEFNAWFDSVSDGESAHYIPAVVARSDDEFKVIAKGKDPAAGLPAA
jgi:hypothetical protein